MPASPAAAPLTGGLTALDIGVVVVYLLAMLGMGAWIAMRQKSTEDFFLGGRKLPAWAVGISIIASLLSTITYLGMPGEMFRSGLGFLSRELGVPLVLCVVWFVWIPFFMRLRLTSAYEYLERRFDYPTRALAAVFCLLLLFGWMSVVVLTASKAMSEIALLNVSWFLGENIPGTRTSPEGLARINVEDVTDWPALVNAIAADGREVKPTPAGRIWERLPDEVRVRWPAGASLSPEDQQAVAANLSNVLQDREFFDSTASSPDLQTWRGMPLPRNARDYLKADPDSLSERELTHLNRTLLGAAFPNAIAAVRPEHRDADMHVLIIAIGLFSVLYTTLGGMRAVVWTDVVQFVILLAGALFTMGTVAVMTNSGISDWIAVSQTYKHETVEWYSWDVGNRSTVLFIVTGMFFWYTCTHGSNQVALQRYFSVRNVWAARQSYLISAVSSFLLALILAGVGMSLMYFIRHHQIPAELGITSAVESVRNEAQDKMFPQFIRLYLPSGLRGLVVAALFAAAMSTIDSGANSVATIVTVDFFRRLNAQGVSAASELKLARILTATMGIIIVAATVFLYHISKGTDLISLCQKGFNCFLGPLGGLFVLGMFSKRATAATVIPAVFIGEALGVCLSYSRELFGVAYSTHLVVPGSWLATVVSGLLFSLLFRTRASEEQQQLLWLPVVRTAELPD